MSDPDPVEPLTFDRPLDLARMHRVRHERLVDAMNTQDVDALVLLGQSNVGYATGARVPAADQARAIHRRPVAIVTSDGAPPHLWTACPDGVPVGFDAAHVHDALNLEWEEGARALLDVLPPGSVAFDEMTMPVRAAVRDAGRAVLDGSGVLATAKATKTPDELECIRRAQAINEAAVAHVRTMAHDGVPLTALTGALLGRIFELGATGNTVDPVWQVMPSSIATGPWSATGDVVFPTVTTAEPLAAGDVVWVDNGVAYEGYQSDYGHTWVIDTEPDDRQRAQCSRWRELVAAVREVIKPGATGRDLTRAAGEVHGRRPWLAHLYLAHGTGTDSAEMPFIGTDLGEAFDEAVVLAPSMVMVLEPVIWEDGYAGFRAEEIVAVTDDGHEVLSTLTWDGWE